VTRVLVVGAGIAGTAAALVAAHAGASVSVVAMGSGATRLSSGAMDGQPWELGANFPRFGADERLVLDALSPFVAVPAEGALVASLAGIVRPARAADRALLDLRRLEAAEVLVAGDHAAFDAVALARCLSDTPEANQRRLRFAPLAASLLRRVEEHHLSEADLAALHDDDDRLDWLSARLKAELRGRTPAAILLPAWLGIDRPRAEELSVRTGVPCGEVLTGLAGPSGMRFERARDRAFDAHGVKTQRARVASIRFEHGWYAALETEEEPRGPFDAIVLAIGGLIGGGLDYCPGSSLLATELPKAPVPILRATVEGPVQLGLHGAPLDLPSSLFGAAPESHAWPFTENSLLERGGVLVDPDGRVRGAPAGLYACGDVVADHPRTWLEALGLGARAGAALTTALRRS
jgi:glycerol-3-phosphate dehydrogenase subunit B